MLSTTGTSPRCGSTTLPRQAEIANKIVVPIVDRSPVVHIGGRSCKIALMTGQLVPHATAMAARRAIASRRRNRSGFIRQGRAVLRFKKVVGNPADSGDPASILML